MPLLLIMLIAAAAPTASPDTSPSSVVQCHADSGRFRLVKLNSSEATLSAQVRVLRQDPKPTDVGEWSSAAGMLFILPNKKVAGVQVYVESGEPDKAKVLIRKPRGDTADFAEAPADSTVPITARADTGVLTVSAGPIQQSTRINEKQIMGAALMCSSGDFEFVLGSGLQADEVASDPSFNPWEAANKQGR